MIQPTTPRLQVPAGSRWGRKLHMADLISEIALILDRPISDNTGFTDEFDVDLNFAPDQALQGSGFGPDDPHAARPPTPCSSSGARD
jgi:uncharacterized protein (TIGR03435 family)